MSLDLSEEELLALSHQRILALTVDEMKAIRDYFADETVICRRRKVGLSREVTDVELESSAQTRSEHCKHKIFNSIIEYEDDSGNKSTINSLFKTFIKGATQTIRDHLGDKELVPFRFRGQCRRYCLQQRVQSGLQGGNSQFSIGSRSLWRSIDGNSGGKPGCLGNRQRGMPDFQRRHLLLCRSFLRQAFAGTHTAPPKNFRRRPVGGRERWKPERHSRGERLYSF